MVVIMEAGRSQSPSNADIKNSKKRLWDGSIFSQGDSQEDHEDHQGIAVPFLEGKGTWILLLELIDPLTVLSGESGKTKPIDQRCQDDTRDEIKPSVVYVWLYDPLPGQSDQEDSYRGPHQPGDEMQPQFWNPRFKFMEPIHTMPFPLHKLYHQALDLQLTDHCGVVYIKGVSLNRYHLWSRSSHGN